MLYIHIFGVVGGIVNDLNNGLARTCQRFVAADKIVFTRATDEHLGLS